MPRQPLTEAGAVGEAKQNGDGSLPVQIITPGWGSSGYYSAEVIEAAATEKVWPAGTHMFFDHPTQSEAAERPGRSVKDLGAVLAEDATWNGKALVARVTPIGLGKTVLADKDFRKAVGVSVRASAEMDVGEAEGRTGMIIERILPNVNNSVDFVTRAGRGGMILESAKAAQESGELDSDRRDKFRDAIRDAYAEDKVEVWVSDYDDTTVYFERWGGDNPGVFSQPYDESDDTVTLKGEPTQVRVKRTYVPVDEAAAVPRTVELTQEAAVAAIREARNVGTWMESRIHLGFTVVADEMFGDGRLTREERIALSAGIGAALDAFTTSVEASAPQLYGRDLWADPAALAEAAINVPVHPAGQSNTTKEHTMPQIEEAQLRTLEEAAGRVPMLEAERDTEKARADKAEHDLKIAEARDYAREFGTKRVKDANSELPSDVVEKVVFEAMRVLTLGEDNRLDTEAFGTRVDDARKAEETYLAKVIENSGATVRGLGPVGETKEVTRSDSNKAIAEAFGRETQEA